MADKEEKPKTDEEEFPPVELPDVDFDRDEVRDLIELSQLTKDSTSLSPFNQAAAMKLTKLSAELKKQIDEAMEEYNRQVQERLGKIAQKRAKEAQDAKSEEDRKAEEASHKRETARREQQDADVRSSVPPPQARTQPEDKPFERRI